MEKEKKMAVTVENLTRAGRCGSCGWQAPVDQIDLIWLCADCGTYNMVKVA